VVFDWAGTTVDFGSRAPAEAFVKLFARYKVSVSLAEARKPMGTHKRDHLLAMLSEPAIAARWRHAHGRDWTPDDLETLYRALVPLQLESLETTSRLVPGLLDVLAWLRSRGIKIAGTTGYFRAAAARVATLAAEQGYIPDVNICGDDVPAGRPAPWMIFRCMEATNVYPPGAVLKVGDTLPDIHEGRNAGAWSVGVIDSSSEIGLGVEEWSALSDRERTAHRDRVGQLFREAGAHAVIATLAELPALEFFHA
jgi:phosphonoacetaldehyde hydrolase